MHVFLKARLAVLAMPKTGSTALDEVLAPLADLTFQGDPRVKHMPMRRFDRFIRPYLAQLDEMRFESCCLVREPVSWLGSWFRYRQRPLLDGHPNSTKHMDFNQFVEAYLAEPQPPYAHVGYPHKFVEGRFGRTDHLFRYDNWGAYIRFLSDRLNADFAPPQRNISPNAELDLHPSILAALKTRLPEMFALYDAAK